MRLWSKRILARKLKTQAAQSQLGRIGFYLGMEKMEEAKDTYRLTKKVLMAMGFTFSSEIS